MDIPDGDLVRLARDGDPAAFRLLVERHLPMARARAARAGPRRRGRPAQIPADANLIRFGVFLSGGGQVELRSPALAPHPPGRR
jgi:hypothetical protein